MALPWIIGGGLALLGAAVAAAVSDDDDDDDDSSEKQARKALKAKKRAAICKRASDEAGKFIQAHDAFLAVPTTTSALLGAVMGGAVGGPVGAAIGAGLGTAVPLAEMMKANISCPNITTLKSAYAPFLEAYSAKYGRGAKVQRVDLHTATWITDSLNKFKNPLGSITIAHSAQHGTAWARAVFLEKARRAAQGYSGQDMPDVLKEYAQTSTEAEELLRVWEGLRQNMTSTVPRIVVCGMLKAGKSSLLDMLSEHVEDDPPFKIDEVRATIAEQMLEYGDLCYVDTPGLDATPEDAEIAWQSYLKAECLIFVHALLGELTQPELDIITRLHKERPITTRNMLVALTHSEEHGGDEEKLERLEQRIAEQLESALGIRPWMAAVSNTCYKKGKKEGKPGLVEISNIPSLQAHIQSLRDTLQTEALEGRKAELAEIMRKVAALIEKDIADAELSISTLTASDEQAYAGMLREYKEICTHWQKEVDAYKSAN